MLSGFTKMYVYRVIFVLQTTFAAAKVRKKNGIRKSFLDFLTNKPQNNA